MSETVDYRPMWEDLGLDLQAHDALLGVLGPLYQETFLGQTNRPEGMQYFDFVMSEVHGLRIKELQDARAAGRKVFGSFCVFVPEEIVLALDGVLVGLCAGAEFAPELAEGVLPRNTCALIKGAFGFAMARVCPYLAAADLVVGENTCDGKKKSYEIFGQYVNDLYVMDVPQMKSEAGYSLLKTEIRRFADRAEALTGKTLTADNLQQGIARVNAKRAAMHRWPLCARPIQRRSRAWTPCSPTRSTSTTTRNASPPRWRRSATRSRRGSRRARAWPTRARRGSSSPAARWPCPTGSCRPSSSAPAP